MTSVVGLSPIADVAWNLTVPIWNFQNPVLTLPKEAGCPPPSSCFWLMRIVRRKVPRPAQLRWNLRGGAGTGGT